jgi:hypothetical protein
MVIAESSSGGSHSGTDMDLSVYSTPAPVGILAFISSLNEDITAHFGHKSRRGILVVSFDAGRPFVVLSTRDL